MRAALLTAVLLLVAVVRAAPLELHFIDVGQGDAVLIRTPDGRAALYDGGRSSGPVLGHLEAQGVARLDLVVASHADADHIGGLADVVARYRPGWFMDNGLPHTTDAYARLLEAVEAAGSVYLEPVARTIGLGDTALHVLPPLNDPSAGQNANSVGLVIEHGGFRAALAGDAEPAAFEAWEARHPDLMRAVHVYKSSHHGGRDGDTPLSVDRFRPELVVVGVGAGNPYGHPTSWAQRLYAAVDAEVLRTDRHGTVVVRARRDGTFEVETSRDGADPASPEAAATPGPGATGPAVVACVRFDPEGRDDGREVVVVEARERVDLSGWTLSDAADHRFPLPSRTLEAGETLEVPNRGRPVWNNDGDEATLRAPWGVADRFAYRGGGSAACR